MTVEEGQWAVELTTDLAIAWLSNANTRVVAEDVPDFITRVHATISALEADFEKSDPQPEVFQPAVSVRKSLASRDHILSMIDGKPYKALRRHLSGHGLTPQAYRERYGLKDDYPMVAENYSRARREMAKKLGLGRRPDQTRNLRDPKM